MFISYIYCVGFRLVHYCIFVIIVCMTFVCCLHNFVIKSYMYGILKVTIVDRYVLLTFSVKLKTFSVLQFQGMSATTHYQVMETPFIIDI